MKAKKSKKSIRLRDVSVSDTFSYGEIARQRDVFEDTPVVVKLGNKNFRLVSDKVVGRVLVLIAKR